MEGILHLFPLGVVRLMMRFGCIESFQVTQCLIISPHSDSVWSIRYAGIWYRRSLYFPSSRMPFTNVITRRLRMTLPFCPQRLRLKHGARLPVRLAFPALLNHKTTRHLRSRRSSHHWFRRYSLPPRASQQMFLRQLPWAGIGMGLTQAI